MLKLYQRLIRQSTITFVIIFPISVLLYQRLIRQSTITIVGTLNKHTRLYQRLIRQSTITKPVYITQLLTVISEIN